MTNPPTPSLLDELERQLGPRGFTRDPKAMAPWLEDWRGRVRGQAAALLSPGSTEEVQAIVRLAARDGVAIVAQGGNSGMVAGAIPDGGGAALLLSLRRMRSIRSLSADDNVAVAEAGVILQSLHEQAAGIGRRFPLSLAAKGSATIGGLVSTNAGGTQVLRFGTMRALTLGVEAVLPDGARFDGLSALRKDNRGYDLRQLLVGAEGTLGIVTAAALRLVPAVADRAVAWAGLERADQALALLRRLESRLGEAIESFEIVPTEGLALVLRHIPGARPPLAGRHRWNVLIEATAAEGAPAPGPLLEAALVDALEAGLIEDVTLAGNEAQADALWALRENMSEAERADGMAAKHDVSVPVSAMPRLLEEGAHAVEERFPGVRVLAFGHLGDGNVHFNVRPPLGADNRLWLETAGAEVSAYVHDLVGEAGGSLSAEHGIGQTKRAELARTIDPVRLHVLRAIKTALDPQGIMNPGKLVP